MKVAIYPYSPKTKGGKALMSALGHKFTSSSILLGLTETDPTRVKGATLLNWGSGTIHPQLKHMVGRIINKPDAVSICGNKVKFFQHQTDAASPARIPVFTTDINQAMEWVQEGLVVMGRSARGSCGTDIVFYEEDPEDFASSEFWVQYKKKKEEYRIHIVGGDVIATQKKSLRTDDGEGQKIDNSTVDFRIRNHRNGFIFKRNDIQVPGDVVDQALLAFKNVGLDFGAVDVIWNQYEGKAYVLEINTAPGLEGTTVTDYATALKALIAA